jgi:hypothetical protein
MRRTWRNGDGRRRAASRCATAAIRHPITTRCPTPRSTSRATPDPLLDAAAAQRLDHPELLRDARHHAPPSGAALLGPPLAAAAVQRPDHLELTATRRPAPLLFQELSDPPRWLAGRLLQRPVPPNAHRAGGSPAPHTNLVQRSSALHTAAAGLFRRLPEANGRGPPASL